MAVANDNSSNTPVTEKSISTPCASASSMSSNACIASPRSSPTSPRTPRPPHDTVGRSMLPKRERKLNNIIRQQSVTSDDEGQRFNVSEDEYGGSASFSDHVTNLSNTQLPNIERTRRRSSSFKDASEITDGRWRRSSHSPRAYSDDEGNSSDSSLRRFQVSPLNKRTGTPVPYSMTGSPLAHRSRSISNIEESKETHSSTYQMKYWKEEEETINPFNSTDNETDSDVEHIRKTSTHIPEPPSQSKRRNSYTRRYSRQMDPDMSGGERRNSDVEGSSSYENVNYDLERRRYTSPAVLSHDSYSNDSDSPINDRESSAAGIISKGEINRVEGERGRSASPVPISSESRMDESELNSRGRKKSFTRRASFHNVDANIDVVRRKSTSHDLLNFENQQEPSTFRVSERKKSTGRKASLHNVDIRNIEEYYDQRRRKSTSALPLVEPVQNSTLTSWRKSSVIEPGEVGRNPGRKVSFHSEHNDIENKNISRRKSVPFSIDREKLEINENPDLIRKLSTSYDDNPMTNIDTKDLVVKKTRRKSNPVGLNAMNEMQQGTGLEGNDKCRKFSTPCARNTVAYVNKMDLNSRRNSTTNINDKTLQCSRTSGDTINLIKPLGERRKSILKTSNSATNSDTDWHQGGRVTATEHKKDSPAQKQNLTQNFNLASPKARRVSYQQPDANSTKPRRASSHELMKRKTSKVRRDSTHQQSVDQQRKFSLATERRQRKVSTNPAKPRRYSTNTIDSKNSKPTNDKEVSNRTVSLLQRSQQLAKTMASYKKPEPIIKGNTEPEGDKHGGETTSEEKAPVHEEDEVVVGNTTEEDFVKENVEDSQYEADSDDSDDLYYDTHVATKAQGIHADDIER